MTTAAGVPTIYNLLYQHLKEKSYDLSSLHIGLDRRRGGVADDDGELRARLRHHDPARLGHDRDLAAGHDLAIEGRHGKLARGPSDRGAAEAGSSGSGRRAQGAGRTGEDLPWDGEHVGELAVRGPWIASSYYKNPGASSSFTDDGWFRTGDMVTIDREGYVQITDRKKDLIKRKGEWISSVDMENAVLANPGVAEAAVIGRHDEICDEVPVVLVVRRDPARLPVQPQDIINVLSTTFRKWQLPGLEDIHFVESLPKTSVGKLDKKVMRKMLADL